MKSSSRRKGTVAYSLFYRPVWVHFFFLCVLIMACIVIGHWLIAHSRVPPTDYWGEECVLHIIEEWWIPGLNGHHWVEKHFRPADCLCVLLSLFRTRKCVPAERTADVAWRRSGNIKNIVCRRPGIHPHSTRTYPDRVSYFTAGCCCFIAWTHKKEHRALQQLELSKSAGPDYPDFLFKVSCTLYSRTSVLWLLNCVLSKVFEKLVEETRPMNSF